MDPSPKRRTDICAPLLRTRGAGAESSDAGVPGSEQQRQRRWRKKKKHRQASTQRFGDLGDGFEPGRETTNPYARGAAALAPQRNDGHADAAARTEAWVAEHWPTALATLGTYGSTARALGDAHGDVAALEERVAVVQEVTKNYQNAVRAGYQEGAVPTPPWNDMHALIAEIRAKRDTQGRSVQALSRAMAAMVRNTKGRNKAVKQAKKVVAGLGHTLTQWNNVTPTNDVRGARDAIPLRGLVPAILTLVGLSPKAGSLKSPRLLPSIRALWALRNAGVAIPQEGLDTLQQTLTEAVAADCKRKKRPDPKSELPLCLGRMRQLALSYGRKQGPDHVGARSSALLTPDFRATEHTYWTAHDDSARGTTPTDELNREASEALEQITQAAQRRHDQGSTVAISAVPKLSRVLNEIIETETKHRKALEKLRDVFAEVETHCDLKHAEQFRALHAVEGLGNCLRVLIEISEHYERYLRVLQTDGTATELGRLLEQFALLMPLMAWWSAQAVVLRDFDSVGKLPIMPSRVRDPNGLQGLCVRVTQHVGRVHLHLANVVEKAKDTPCAATLADMATNLKAATASYNSYVGAVTDGAHNIWDEESARRHLAEFIERLDGLTAERVVAQDEQAASATVRERTPAPAQAAAAADYDRFALSSSDEGDDMRAQAQPAASASDDRNRTPPPYTPRSTPGTRGALQTLASGNLPGFRAPTARPAPRRAPGDAPPYDGWENPGQQAPAAHPAPTPTPTPTPMAAPAPAPGGRVVGGVGPAGWTATGDGATTREAERHERPQRQQRLYPGTRAAELAQLMGAMAASQADARTRDSKQS